MKLLFLLACLSLPSLLALGGQEPKEEEREPEFAGFRLADLVAEAGKRPWLPFLDTASLQCGLYRLPAGGTDGQGPHGMDEVYYVVSGKSKFRAGDEEGVAEPGAILFVAAGVEHRFFDIEEDLEIVVFFSKGAPADRREGAEHGADDEHDES